MRLRHDAGTQGAMVSELFEVVDGVARWSESRRGGCIRARGGEGAIEREAKGPFAVVAVAFRGGGCSGEDVVVLRRAGVEGGGCDARFVAFLIGEVGSVLGFLMYYRRVENVR